MMLGVMWPIGKLPHVPHPQSEVLPVVIVEALYPPQQWSVRLTDVYGMHKCIGSRAELGATIADKQPIKQTRKVPRVARGMSAKDSGHGEGAAPWITAAASFGALSRFRSSAAS